MLTIAGGIVLGFLALGVIRRLFGGPTRAELLGEYVRRTQLENDAADKEIAARTSRKS